LSAIGKGCSQQGIRDMRVFIFKSQTRQNLCAFAGDMAGSRLPEKYGPWRLINTAPRGGALPYDVPRPAIERAITLEGFQMFRMKAPEEAL
jgi:hypothetical protein